MALAPFTSVDEVLTALAGLDGMPTDDVVAALPHLLQTAELLDDRTADDPELVVAGLLHDLASALELGCPRHELEGSRIVRPLFGDRVAELIAGHTDAKRYLVSTDPTYLAGLSANSTATLARQGGVMDDAERDLFANRDEVDALVALRRADDSAKDPRAASPTVAAWRDLLDAVARTPMP